MNMGGNTEKKKVKYEPEGGGFDLDEKRSLNPYPPEDDKETEEEQ